MTTGVLRWGICCASKIGFDFCAALRLLPSTEHDIVAVAARNKDKAQEFADKLGIPVAYGSYEELAKDQNIDVVYIGSIHPYHYSLCTLFLSAGKNVLCEKPITMNSRQLAELVKLAWEKQVFLMEGFWSRFFPIYQRTREAIKNEIGDLLVLSAEFGGNSQGSNSRMSEKEMGGGALMDMGCYAVMYANFVFGGEKPQKITANAMLTDQGVDAQTNITLEYSGGRMARLFTSMVADLNETAVIHGTTGKIVAKNFWSPEEIVINGATYTNDPPIPRSKLTLNYRNSEGFVYEARCVRECILKGLKECPEFPLQESLDIMNILDEVRRQIGCRYPADDH